MDTWKKILMWIPVIGFLFIFGWYFVSGESLVEEFSEAQLHFSGAMHGISIAIVSVVTIIIILL